MELTQQIKELALKHCEDYPKIEHVDAYEQLYALSSTLDGLNGAIEDLHATIEDLSTILIKGREEVDLTDGFLAKKTKDDKWALLFKNRHIQEWEGEFYGRSLKVKYHNSFLLAYLESRWIRDRHTWYKEYLKKESK